MSEIPVRTSRFVEMPGNQSVGLLAATQVGRVAWHGPTGLQIVPVSYAYHRDTVVFSASSDSLLSELASAIDVVLEIDDLDQTYKTGWSVVIHGRAEAVPEPQELRRLWTLDGVAAPWTPGARDLCIQIRPSRISGRVLQREIE
jgi:nitroimidazol reductase NimA-like FMN-containing flavoprotein (pyridoxamine 5'-phosphate oxidase superfamily)